MKNIIVDAGPLIALFDKDDKYHNSVLKFLKTFDGQLITSWPVITEVTHLLSFNVNVQIDFLEWLKREAVTIVNLENIHLERIIQLSKKYSDVPMDLADSSLIVIAELTNITDIITIDSDYYIYKTKNKKSLNNILLPFLQNKKN
ncbi:MAG TPA: PIN domain-containing protein [Spirochaetota bacterium]|nr:PIN domain-containing protein [Spirochaetota bacterium]HPJ36536.1 PIN domain-containing protein [Spirochaetota bacterium]